MSITNNGFEARRFPEIREAIRQGLQTTLATPIKSSADTVIGTILSIFAEEVALEESLQQSLDSQLDIDRAEGVYLDRAVAYVGLQRRAASPASGQLRVWRDNVGDILSPVTFRDVNGVEYTSVGSLTHSLSQCSEVLLTPSGAVVGSNYDIVINGTTYSYTVQSGDVKSDIVTALAGQITGATSLTVVVEGDNIRITELITDQNSLEISLTRMSVVEIATYSYIESINTGNISVTEGTIDTIVTASATLLRCNNPLPFTDGQERESDEALRARHQVSVQVSGAATVPAIVASLRQLQNVSSVTLIENRDIVTDPQGRPAKSYECIVVGGNPTEISQTIWDTKPAGIETYGSISSVVKDYSGKDQVVNWSRPNPVYVLVRVSYDIYDEETFPTSGEDAIAQAVLDYGNSLDLGKDVIPTRFIGPIYNNVSGIGNLTIEVGTSVSPTATTPDGGWVTTNLSIADNEFADFASGRVFVQQI